MLARILLIGAAFATSAFGAALVVNPRMAAPLAELQRPAMALQRPGRPAVVLRPELAATPVERAVALAGRTRGAQPDGMYVEVPVSGASLSTSDYLFPVDVVMLDGSGSVVEIRKGVAPGGQIAIRPDAAAYVLLENGGARKAGFGIGSRLKSAETARST